MHPFFAAHCPDAQPSWRQERHTFLTLYASCSASAQWAAGEAQCDAAEAHPVVHVECALHALF